MQHILTAAYHQQQTKIFSDLTEEEILKDVKEYGMVDITDNDTIKRKITSMHKQFHARRLAVTASQSHMWTISVPTIPLLRLTNLEYIISTKMRLGLKPHDAMELSCRGCSVPIEDCNYYHYMSCNLKLSGSMIARHNHIINIIRYIVQLAGGASRTEPVHLTDNNGNRTDIEVIMGDKHYQLDVSIVSPLSLSYLTPTAKPTQLQLAKRKAVAKTSKHIQNSTSAGATFIPFIVEIFGGMINECKTFLEFVIRNSYDFIPNHVHSYLKSNLFHLISVAIQQGNSLLYNRGVMVKV
jgi:hypothetical protein